MIFLSLGPAEIDQLAYRNRADDDPPLTPLSGLQKLNLKKMQGFRDWYCVSEGIDELTEDGWYAISNEDFDTYRQRSPAENLGRTWRDALQQDPNAPTPTAATASAPVTIPWAQGIKRDTEAYPTFSDGKFWDNWNREFKTKASLHGVSKVLDPTYVPLPGIKTTNFKVMKEFVYAVFLSKI